MIVAGLMSGSSLDGLDIAFVSFADGGTFTWMEGTTVPIPKPLATRLTDYQSLTTRAYVELERDFSLWIASSLTQYCRDTNVRPALAGVHGHTLLHLPADGLTAQLGHGGIIAAAAGIDVVTDFRMQDITHGGVGTPLVSILEKQLLSGYDYYLNLGGIANITHIATDGIAAYDVCPCNQLLNHYSMLLAGLPYDAEGQLAQQGTYRAELIEQLDGLPYWTTPAPKAIDNQWIRDVCIPLIDSSGSAADILHTLCCWIATKIAAEIDASQPSQMLITGGGAYNDLLLEKISTALTGSNCAVATGPDYLTDYKEAILMAYMAYLRVREQPSVLAEVTGARQDSCAGAYYKATV